MSIYRFVDDIALELLKESPFYSRMLRACRVEVNNESENIAQVRVKNGVEIIINKDMMEKYPIQSRAGFVEHEFHHLFRGHIRQYRDKMHDVYAAKCNLKGSHQAFNIAVDAEVNTKIKSLRDDPISGQAAVKKAKMLQEKLKNGTEAEKKAAEQYFEKFKDEVQFVFPETIGMTEGRPWNEYYMKIVKDAIEDGNIAKSLGGMMPENGDGEYAHSHDYFEDSLEDGQLIDQIVSKKAEEVKNGMQAGQVPREVEEFIQEVKKNAQLPWNVLLKQFIQSILSTERTSTWKKTNRRFPEERPGAKRVPQVHIAIGLDESGSVCDAEREEFMAEIDAIANENVKIDVIHFDSEASEPYEYRGQLKGRQRYGGTDFRPVHEKVIENNYSGLVMLTDGCGPSPQKQDVTYQTLWVLNCSMDMPYGQTVVLPNRKGRKGWPY